MGRVTAKRRNDTTGGGEATVRITGAMTIAQAAAIHAELLHGLAAAPSLCVDASVVEEADLAGLQLLCSGHRASIGAGKGYRLVFTADGAVARTAEAAGYHRQVGCEPDKEGTCIWVGRVG